MISRRRALALFLELTACLSACAQKSLPPSPVAGSANYSQESSIIEEMSTKLAFENGGTFTREQTSRILVQTDAGVQRWGLLSFSFQAATQTVEIDYVRVLRPDGTTMVTPPANVQDLDAEITRSAPFYSDLREKHVAVKGLGKGDILEYRAHWSTTKPLIPGQFWFQYSFQHDGVVLDERLEVRIPADRAVKVKGLSAAQSVTTAAGSRIYSWTYSKLQSAKESGSDQKREAEAMRGRLPVPDVQISSFQSWDEVGRWYWDLQKDRIEPSPEVRAKAAELTKGMTDDAAKLQALYSFVSTQYRYIGIAFGIGRYQPHSADDVLTNNYGDCKDKHTLLAALLQASGVTLYPALISSSRALDPDIPSPAQFDHIIGYLPQSKDKNHKDSVWLDTTAEIAPLGYLVVRLRDKQALVMLGGKSAQLIRTPVDPPFPNSAVFRIDGKLSDSGTLDAKMERTDRGDSEVVLRSAFRSAGQSQWKDLMQRISFNTGYSGTVSEVEASAPEATWEPFHISYSYNRKDYPDWSNHHITAPPPAFLLPVASEDENQPKEPLWLGSTIEISSEARIELPKGYTPQLPAALNLARDFAEYHSTYSQSRGLLVVQRRLVTKVREVPITELADYKDFNRRMQEDANQFVETSSAAAPAGNAVQKGAEFRIAIEALPDSKSPEANLLETDAVNAMKTYDITRAEYSLKTAVAKDPKFTRGWLRLGVIYAGLAATTDAIATFHNAVDSDPSRPISYKILADALLTWRRPTEAITTWQDLLKIAPDDHDAVSNLGSLLFIQKRYAEALPYLETAAKNDDSSTAQSRLGSVYLRTRETEKGVAIFQKIVDADSSAGMLNNVAYEFAEAGASLSKALEYANRAVRQQEQILQSINLDDLKTEDLDNTVKVGYYWDTLGWIHFRLGNFEQAESYLNAAWVLSQMSIVADHLGQVYEQEKKTENAIRMYRMALSAPTAQTQMVGDDLTETRKRLAHLSPKSKTPTKTDLFRHDPKDISLSQMRLVRLPRFVPGHGSCEFFLLFGPGPKVESVRFISGTENLKVAGKVLTSAKFPVEFPADSSARLLRRAMVVCEPVTGCQALLLPPDGVHSVK